MDRRWYMSTKTRKPPKLLNLIALAAVGPLAMNILFASMPGMVVEFDTTLSTVQWALTLYLFALAFAQLYVGPISDRFGRRPVVLWGMAICAFGSIVCIFAPTIEVLISGRFFQAVGACTGLVMARTIIRDLYGLDKAASMIGYLTMVMVLAPMFAPVIGAYLDESYGWQASFVLVLVMTILVLLVTFAMLGESHHGPYPSVKIGPVVRSFLHLLTLPHFNRHAFQISLSSAAFFAFIGGAPYVSIDLLGLTKVEFGLYFMFGGAGYMAGNFITGKMSERWGAEGMISLGTGFGMLGGGVLTIAYLTGYLSPFTLFGSMGLIALGNGLCLPSGTASAISADKDRIGAAAGLAGFLQMAIGALASYVVGVLLSKYQTALPLVILMTGSVTLAFVGNRIGRRQQSRTHRHSR
jgi:DHA1 family bicyclomycin/chloramphenicol resistance-like MFS transporter